MSFALKFTCRLLAENMKYPSLGSGNTLNSLKKSVNYKIGEKFVSAIQVID